MLSTNIGGKHFRFMFLHIMLILNKNASFVIEIWLFLA